MYRRQQQQKTWVQAGGLGYLGGTAAITQTSTAQHCVLGVLTLDADSQMLRMDTLSPGGGSVSLGPPQLCLPLGPSETNVSTLPHVVASGHQ